MAWSLVMRRPIVVVAALTIGLPACRSAVETPGGAQGAPSSDIAPEIAREVLANMDRKADPCQDFFRYACGGWLDNTEIPSDESRYGRFHALRERNEKALHEILSGQVTQPGAHDGSADRRKPASYYAACMDETAIEAAGVEPVMPTLALADGVEDVRSLMAAAGQLHRRGVGVLFDVHVGPDYANPDLNIAHLSQGGLGLPDREYYLGTDDRARALRDAYRAHVARILELAGQSDAERQAEAVLAFEARLAEAWTPRDQLRNPEKRYFPVDRAKLAELTPDLPWDAYFDATGHFDVDALNVAPKEYFERMAAIASQTKPSTLRAYVRWHVLSKSAKHLTKAFATEHFEFYGKTLRGQRTIEPRWKRCVESTDRALGELLGRDYVEREFAGDSKDIALDMIRRIEEAFADGLDDLSWMDPSTRERALEKMHAIVNKIGYPDKWRDYSRLEIGADHLANVLAATEFEFDRQAHEIGKPVDRAEWHMTPPTVNAYYNPSGNEMVFPAGILQPPFFDPEYPMAMNFGGIGMVMGHELTHGFDDQGRKFDGSGKLTQWWEDEAVQRFEERAACVEGLYDGYEVQPGLNLNGKLTLGENIADFGGIKEAFSAYRSWAAQNDVDIDAEATEGLTHAQLFFLSYGQIWCAKATPEVERVLAVTDPHAHAKYRVNGPLSNLPEFGEAFACEPGEPMRPKNVCEVW